jgi:Concanavalin A-like lectin/glucanases superfamily
MWGRAGTRWAMYMALVLGALGAPDVAGADTSVVLGQWRFDESGGQVAFDDGPHGLDGRLGLTDGIDAQDPERIPGLSGGALRFDGDSFVRLPTADELKPPTMTLEAVVRGATSPGPFRYVVSHGAQGCFAGSYGMYTGQTGGVAFYVFDGEHYYVTPAAGAGAVWDGGWHHVAGVYDGGRLRLFLDGHPVGQAFPVPSTIAYTLASDDHYLGTYQGTCALPLTGDVDLVRMWRGPLAADYVGVLSDAALHPATPAPSTGVPSATQSESDAGALATRTVIEPALPGQTYAAPAPATSRPVTAATPGAPARACAVTPSATRLRTGRPTTITVRVAYRGSPLKRARVVAMAASRRRLAAGRTAANGRVRLVLKTARPGTIRVKVAGRADCGTASLRVVR